MPVVGNLINNPQPVSQSGSWTVNTTGNTNFKLQSSVRLIGAATATLVVPAGQIFKGILGANGVLTGAAQGMSLRLRDNNSSGTILAGHSSTYGGSNLNSGNDGVTSYVELSAGTYFLEATTLGSGTYTFTVSIIGGLYANS